MKLNAYSIYDRKALQYHPPFFASTDGAAVRSFADLANDANTGVGRHPADYVLYRIGVYSDQDGGFVPLVPLDHVMDAQALVRLQPELFADLSGVARDANGTDYHANSPEAQRLFAGVNK